MLAFILLSCGHPAKTETSAAVKAPSIFLDPAPHSREANDAARFLAGLPGTDGSAFSTLEQQDAWKLHRKELDRMWGRTESETISAMRDFQTRELNDAPIRNSLIFYPFSGPDALMVNVFFPNNTTYVMVGLEPPGTLPAPVQFAKKNLALTLAAERVTVNDVLGKSFFITRQMDKQFRGQVTDGLFQPIVHLLVRTNHTIVGYQYVQLSDEGKVIGRAASGPLTTKLPNRGIEVDFTSQGSDTVHRMFYFSINLSDERLKDNQAFSAFVANMKGSSGMTSYFKATSYMTHHTDFSIIRDQVLNNSTAVLQDDSGIPYHFFAAPAWHVQLYGDYERPYGSFRWLEQKDLRDAYKAAAAKPLPFRIGYGFSRQPSNMLFATKTVLTAAR